MRPQAIRARDRLETFRSAVLGFLVAGTVITFVVIIASTEGFIVDSPAQSTFNACVTEQFAASRAAGSQFSWSQVQVDCTHQALNPVNTVR